MLRSRTRHTTDGDGEDEDLTTPSRERLHSLIPHYQTGDVVDEKHYGSASIPHEHHFANSVPTRLRSSLQPVEEMERMAGALASQRSGVPKEQIPEHFEAVVDAFDTDRHEPRNLGTDDLMRIQSEKDDSKDPQLERAAPVRTFGRLAWEAGPACPYVCVRCPGTAERTKIDAMELRNLMEKDWKLKPPQVLLSVTGGQMNFNLDAEASEDLMSGLAETAKSVGGWFLTGGQNSGIARFVGRARKLHADKVPVIGLLSLGSVKGSADFDKAINQRSHGDGQGPVVLYEKACRADVATEADIVLDPNHSHFVFVDTGEAGQCAAQPIESMHLMGLRSRGCVTCLRSCWSRYTTALKFRAALERSIQGSLSSGKRVNTELWESFKRRNPKVKDAIVSGKAAMLAQASGRHFPAESGTVLSLGHHSSEERPDRQTPSPAKQEAVRSVLPRLESQPTHPGTHPGSSKLLANTPQQPHSWIPCLCVAVNGGAGTLKKICSSVGAGMPVLLLQGSGRATDFMCEALEAFDTFRSRTRGLDATSCFTHDWSADPAISRARTSAGKLGPSMSRNSSATSDSESQQKARLETLKAAFNQFEKIEDSNNSPQQKKEEARQYFEKLTQDKIRDLLTKGHGMRFTGHGQNAARTIFEMVVEHVYRQRQRFYVYELRREKKGKTELKSAVLQCILQCEDSKKERAEDPLWFQNKIRMAVAWDQPQILRDILRSGRANRGADLRRYQLAVEVGVVEALSLGSEESLQALLDFGADYKGIGVSREFLRHGERQQSREDLTTRCREAVMWETLLRQCIRSQRAQHVKIMLQTVKDKIKKHPDMPSSVLRAHGAAGSRWFTYADLRDRRNPNKKEKQNKQQSAAEAMLHNLLWLDGVAVDRGIELWSDAALELQYYCSVHWFVRMDLIYNDLLGEEWRFSAGILGKTWDLFLCMVLLNNHRVAKLVWEKIDEPILAALVACKLNKSMAKRPFIRQELVANMLENAAEFEAIATEVCALAMDESMQEALAVLETRHELLRGKTIFDLAMDCEADGFLVRCCQEVNLRRFFGDLEPTWWYLGLPGWVWCFFCTLAPFGLFVAPYLLDFRLPPDSECSRAPSQRRKIPVHYGEQPNLNQLVKHDLRTKQLKKWKKDEEKYLELSLANRKKIWEPTFGYWEKLWCFLVAPVTAHTLSAAIYTAVVLVFTHIVTAGHVPFDPERLSEWAVCVYMAGFSVLQLTEMFWAGTHPFDFGGRNVNELAIVTLFMLGWAGRFGHHVLHRHQCLETPADSFGLSWQMYRVCSFLCWTRILRLYSVDRKIGTLVRSLWLLAHDIAVFIAFWGVFLVAFACALNGGLKPLQIRGDLDEHGPLKARYWWVLQTYLQVFGEGDEVDHQDDWFTVLIAMTVLLVLQLVLKDTVFTAMLTHKVGQMHDTAHLYGWMGNMYHTSNHFLEFSVPAPFNVVQLLWNLGLCWVNREAVRRIMQDEEDSGLPRTNYWVLQRHLRNPRFVGLHTIPYENEAELDDERKELDAKQLASQASEVANADKDSAAPTADKASARLKNRSTRLAQRALVRRARNRFTSIQRDEGQRRDQMDAEEKFLQTMQGQLEGLDKKSEQFFVKLSTRLNNMERAVHSGHLGEKGDKTMRHLPDVVDSVMRSGSGAAHASGAKHGFQTKTASSSPTQQDGRQDDASKFVAPQLCFGDAVDATRGLRCLLGLESDKEFSDKLSQGMQALLEEWQDGSKEDIANYEYVVNGTARKEEDIPQHVREQFESGQYHGGSLKEEEFDQGHDGMTIHEFVAHENSKTAHLTLPEVVSLRLYTTSSYVAINTPLRDRKKKHPLPMTVYYLSEGLKKLRTIGAVDHHSHTPHTFNDHLELWRGVKDRSVNWKQFEKSGGTELAPMSTTPDRAVAAEYSISESPLLLRYNTQGLSRGCSIQYLSVFPKENEYLYPPLTYLCPQRFVEEDGVSILVVEPQIS